MSAPNGMVNRASHVLAWKPGRPLPTRTNGVWELYTETDFWSGRPQTDQGWRCGLLPRDATAARLKDYVRSVLDQELVLVPTTVVTLNGSTFDHLLRRATNPSMKEPAWFAYDPSTYDGVVPPDWWTADLEDEAVRVARRPGVFRCPECGVVSYEYSRFCGDDTNPVDNTRHRLR